MKVIRSILLTALLTITVFFGVSYTACQKDKCNNVVCLNKGTCDNGTCKCPTGYEGPRCDTLSRNKFIFTYSGGDRCGDSLKYKQFQLQFVTVPFKPLEMRILNMLGDPDDSATATILSVDSFSLQGSNNSTTYNGYGTFRRDTLKMYYEVRKDTTSYTCKYVGGHF